MGATSEVLRQRQGKDGREKGVDRPRRVGCLSLAGLITQQLELRQKAKTYIQNSSKQCATTILNLDQKLDLFSSLSSPRGVSELVVSSCA